jgi:hypothetical protein
MLCSSALAVKVQENQVENEQDGSDHRHNGKSTGGSRSRFPRASWILYFYLGCFLA